MRATALAALLVLLAACSAGTEPTAEQQRPASPPEGVVEHDGLENDHVRGPLEYEQVPPVGGPHNPSWLACDVYDEPVPPETAVHALEHGGVWLTHRPDLASSQVEGLADLTSISEEYVLISPHEDLPAPIVATAWGAQLTVESADDPRLREFVAFYAGGDQGGEGGVSCRSSGLTLEQAREAVGS